MYLLHVVCNEFVGGCIHGPWLHFLGGVRTGLEVGLEIADVLRLEFVLVDLVQDDVDFVLGFLREFCNVVPDVFNDLILPLVHVGIELGLGFVKEVGEVD